MPLFFDKGSPHGEGSYNLNSTLVWAEGDTTALKPALIGIHDDWRFAFFRVGRKYITGTDVNTDITSITQLLVEIDMFVAHSIGSPLPVLSLLSTVRSCLIYQPPTPASFALFEGSGEVYRVLVIAGLASKIAQTGRLVNYGYTVIPLAYRQRESIPSCR